MNTGDRLNSRLNPEEIEDLLTHQVVGRLGCYADGEVYVVPISYAYDGTYIYCHSEEGLKMDMMRRNPNVCFQVDKMNNMADWKSAIAWGKFEELEEKAEKNTALKALLGRLLPLASSETTHLGAQWPFSPDNIDEIGGLFFRIRVDKKTGRFEKIAVSPAIQA